MVRHSSGRGRYQSYHDSWNGQNFTINDSKGEEVKFEGTSMTLIDESIQVGDQEEVRFSEENQPTAIRKVRGS
jgi:hypothetical protein